LWFAPAAYYESGIGEFRGGPKDFRAYSIFCTHRPKVFYDANDFEVFLAIAAL
jgi:hypothetical protein